MSPPSRFPSRHLHLCVCLWGEKKTPNICHMINWSTSLQIRGSMSYSVLSECITIPGQAFSVGCWQIGPCIHQWNDKGMFRCFHLSPLSFCSYTRSRCALLDIATGHNTCSTGGVFSTLVQEERARPRLPPGDFCLDDAPPCSQHAPFLKGSTCISIKLLWNELLPNKITEMSLSRVPVLAAPAVLSAYCDCSQISFRVIH